VIKLGWQAFLIGSSHEAVRLSGEFHCIISKTAISYIMKLNEIWMKRLLSMLWFHRHLILTHKELVIVPSEFHLHETQYSLFIKTLAYHQKYICDRLLNANETLNETYLTNVEGMKTSY